MTGPHGTAKLTRTNPGPSWVRTTIICLAVLLEGMSSSGINVQVVAVQEALSMGRAELGVVTAAFLVAYAGLLPAAGRLVDARGSGRVFLAGGLVFGFGCLVCAAALDGWMLGLGRFVQGAGAALSAPAALALITQALPAGSARNRAVGLYGAMGAIGFSLGLVLPSFAVAALGWRASFLIFVPVVLVVLRVAWTVRRTQSSKDQPVDLPGNVILTALMVLGVLVISGLGTWPLLHLAVPAGAVLLLVLALVRRGGIAGFPGEVLRSPQVTSSCLSLGAVFAGVISSYYVLSLALQTEQGHGPLAVGLMIVPNPIAFALLSAYGARLVSRFGYKRVLRAGLMLIAVALYYLAATGADTPYVLGMLPAQLAIGSGLALCYPAASIGAVDAAPEQYRGTTAGLLVTWQNLGGAIGLALVT
ncbi:MAG: MFS transporter, partial [Actinomycetia bacterium]|nr:MFS transporter [Actinomycetes bacterium]